MRANDVPAAQGCPCGSLAYGFPLGVQFRPHWDWSASAPVSDESTMVLVEVQCLQCDRVLPVPVAKVRLYG